MKILPVVNYSNFTKLERKENNNQTNTIENKNINLLNSIQDNRYLINFCANNENLDKIYKNYGNNNGMPISFDRYLTNISQEEREKRKDTYASYRSVYADMENCHTTTRLKELFPEEFENIKSTFSLKDNKGSFLFKVKEWASLFEGSDDYLFPETKDNDLSVYLAKKIYLEAKTKKEIKEDFIKDVNKSIFSEQDLETLKNPKSGELIPDSVYSKLGLRGDIKSNGFRHSLCLSRQDYIEKYGSIYKSKRKENFEKVLEKVIETKKTEKTEKVNIPKKNTGNYEKMQYIMFYVWNNSLELRRALSDFLVDKKEGDELLIPDLMKINSESDKNSKQYKLMSEFWEKHPEFKNYFSEKCKEAFEVIEESIDKGTFEILKSEIDEKRIETYLILREEKEEKEFLLREKALIKLQEEELKIIKEETRKKLNQVLVVLKDKKPISPILAREINEKIKVLYERIFDKSVNLSADDIKNELEKLTNESKEKVDEAVDKTSQQILLMNKDKLFDKIRKMYKKEYGELDEREEIATGKREKDFLIAISVYQKVGLEEYLKFLFSYPNAEVPKEIRKKKLNSLIEGIRKEDDLKEFLINETRMYIVEEMIRATFEIPPKKLLDMYNKEFKTPKKEE